MCANKELVEEDTEISRVYYMKKIIEKFQSERYKHLTPTQERIYEEALRKLVHFHFLEGSQKPIQDDKDKVISPMHTSSRNVNSHNGVKTRGEVLREVLNCLQNLERRRLYNPPENNEIGYYQVLKYIIRLIITFIDIPEDEGWAVFPDCDKFHHCMRFRILSYVMELEELRDQLKDISSHVIQMDIRNDFSLTPFMGIKRNYKASPISWNKDKGNQAFYQHKFVLALVDLYSSDLAILPPTSDEKKLYDIVIDLVEVPSSLKEASDTNSNLPFSLEDLPYLLHHRIVSIMDRSVQHCTKIITTILAKLSITSTFNELLQCYMNNRGSMVKEFVHHCQVSPEDLPDYIADFNRCIVIAKYTSSLISVSSETISETCNILSDILRGIVHVETEWELIHALTLSDYASYVFPDEFVEIDGGTMFSEKGENKNAVILQDTLQALQYIGISDANRTLDEEERYLFSKIWKKVASAVEFFYSAIAYQQRGTMQSTLSADENVKVEGVKRKRIYHPKVNIDADEGYMKFHSMYSDIGDLERILEAIKKGLIEEPIIQEVKKYVKRNMLCSMNCSLQDVKCRDICLARRMRLASKKCIDW